MREIKRLGLDVKMVAGCDTSRFVLNNFEKYGKIEVYTTAGWIIIELL